MSKKAAGAIVTDGDDVGATLRPFGPYRWVVTLDADTALAIVESRQVATLTNVKAGSTRKDAVRVLPERAMSKGEPWENTYERRDGATVTRWALRTEPRAGSKATAPSSPATVPTTDVDPVAMLAGQLGITPAQLTRQLGAIATVGNHAAARKSTAGKGTSPATKSGGMLA